MSAQKLLIEIQKLPDDERRQLISALNRVAGESRHDEPLSEDEVERTLLAKGIISEIPARLVDQEEDCYEPIEVPGKPLSETIIEDRS